MRVEGIRLERYGPFEDKSVALGSGLSVVYGRNEAGKSTLLNALGDFLWGYSNQNHPRAFTYAAGKMRLTGTVRESGQQHTWTRRLKKLFAADGTEVLPPWDPQQTGSIKEWRQGFGLDLEHLQQGGEDLIAGGSDLADVVFLAQTGVAIDKVRRTLEQRMGKIYKERANSRCEVRDALNRIQKLSDQIEMSSASAVDVAELRVKRDELELENRGQDKLLRDLEREARRLEELGRCFKAAAELGETETELKNLLDLGPVLGRADTDKLRIDLERTVTAAHSIETCQSQLRRLEDKTAQLELHPDVTGQASAINALGHSVKAIEADRAVLRDVEKDESLRSIVLGLLHELGVEAEGSLDTCVAGLRIARDERDQLDRVALKFTDALKELDREQAAVRKAEIALQDRARSADSAEKDAALVDARTRRDQTWSSIREPWLSGELPNDVDRTEMARDLDVDIVGADQVAESKARQRTRAAEIRGEIQADERALAGKRNDLDVANAKFQGAETLWDDLVVERGLARRLDPQGWTVRAQLLDELDAAWQELERYGSEREKAQRNVDVFTVEAERLSGFLGGDDQDPVRMAEALGELLTAASSAEGAGKEIDEQTATIANELQEQKDTLALATSEVTRVAEVNGDESDKLLERSEEALRLLDQQRELVRDLKSLKNPDSDLAILLEKLAGYDEVDRGARADSLAEESKCVKTRVGALHAELGSVKGELSKLESRGSIAELSAERLAEGEQLRNLVDEYRMLRLQKDMLDRYFEQAAEQSQSPVLDVAGEFLSRLTLGRYVGFEIVTDEDQSRIRMQLRDQAGEPANPVELDGLSEGTADQVFLALRLAGIQTRQVQRREAGLPTLPVVLDDVLVAHDDRRSAQALALLAELSEQFQIILLTHHESVLNSTESILGITRVELEPAVSVQT